MGEDWRLMGQERYLQRAVLRWARWWPIRDGSDHDHCEFCTVHFSDHVLEDDSEPQLEGIVTEDDNHWVCRRCFEDFKHRFEFTVRQASG
jgi:hypothetical protein